jgi:uncharacterized protein YidB (DUF937 family)
MGFLDEMGKMLGAASGAQGGGLDVASLLPTLLSHVGGVQGLTDKLQQGGLGEHLASWIGTGQNLPINADQITQALGNSQLGELAGKLGIDPQQLSSQLAQHLPGLVDKISPNGQLPDASSLLAQGADLLKGFMKS